MPYPLGHTAIGLTTYELNGKKATPTQRLWVFIFVLVLSNLPDLDMLAGLIFTGNADAFHRGPSHSLLFAMVMGYAASVIAKRLSAVPPLSFGLCTSLIFSHVLADALFTDAAVSFFWPFEVNFSTGTSSLGDVFHGIFFQSLGDLGIVFGCLLIIGGLRKLRASDID
jgi:membrane-bound metal-dependent hydrolase YbcI (DUF457 family)